MGIVQHGNKYRLRLQVNKKQYSVLHESEQVLKRIAIIAKQQAKLGTFRGLNHILEREGESAGDAYRKKWPQFFNVKVNTLVHGGRYHRVNKAFDGKVPKNGTELVQSGVWEAASVSLRGDIQVCLSSFGNWLVSEGDCKLNPYSMPWNTPNKEIPSPFPPSALEQIEKWFRDNSPGAMYTHFLLRRYTGCRTGEALALIWGDWSYVDKNITISRSLSKDHLGRYRTKGTKTERTRLVFIPGYLHEHLYTLYKAEGDSGTGQRETKRIAQINYEHFLTLWKLCLKQLGLPYKRPYSLRHSRITELVFKKFPVPVVSRMMGCSREILEAHYLGHAAGWSIAEELNSEI